MSILPPHLDPFATGDFDTRCHKCDVNLDNAPTGVRQCPRTRGEASCETCCEAFCCADLSVPPVRTTALTNTIEIEHCDECGAMQPTHEFSQVIGYGLMCPRCVDELRNTGLAS